MECGADPDKYEYNYHEAGLKFFAAPNPTLLRDTHDVEGKIIGSATALHRAVENARSDIGRILLDHEADPHLRMVVFNVHEIGPKAGEWQAFDGMTALDIARSKGYCDIEEILLAHGYWTETPKPVLQ